MTQEYAGRPHARDAHGDGHSGRPSRRARRSPVTGPIPLGRPEPDADLDTEGHGLRHRGRAHHWHLPHVHTDHGGRFECGHGGVLRRRRDRKRQEQQSHGAHQAHRGHGHHPSSTADRRYLWAALLLLVAFVIGEAVQGVLADSMALLSDAGHLLSEAVALGGAMWAMKVADRPIGDTFTYGWKRAEIISAAVNGIILLMISAVIGVESVERILEPRPVEGGPVLVVASIGVAVGIVVEWLVSRADHRHLSVEDASGHLLPGLFGLMGILAAGAFILFTEQVIADTLISITVVVLMLRAGWSLLRDAGVILLEGAPHDVDVPGIREHLLSIPGIKDVHDLHVWAVSAGVASMSAHLVADDECFSDGSIPHMLDAAQRCLQSHFSVEHNTLQFERATRDEGVASRQAQCSTAYLVTSGLRTGRGQHRAGSKGARV